jgi:hypothetical protein
MKLHSPSVDRSIQCHKAFIYLYGGLDQVDLAVRASIDRGGAKRPNDSGQTQNAVDGCSTRS